MKIIEKIKNSDKVLFTLEIVPPEKGYSLKEIFDTIESVKEFSPAVIDVTYHRADYIQVKDKNGSVIKSMKRKRPGTVGICSAILNKFGIDPIPHIICGGFTKEEIEDMVIDLHFLGIYNLLLLQGDKLADEPKFIPTKGGYSYAYELVESVSNMNKGLFLGDETIMEEKFDFCIGVAGYPEKHYAAKSFEDDLKNLKNKVDKGADYVVTQMFFDNQKYFNFVREARRIGISVPIIPGIKPITSKKQLKIVPQKFFTDIPVELSKEINSSDDSEKIKEIGIQWCVDQCKELMKNKVPALHFYTLGKAYPTIDVLRKIF